MTRTLPALAAGLATALLALGPVPAAAQDALVPVPAPEGPRPYPYAILGVQPGDLPGPTEEALEAELGDGIELTPEDIVFQLPAPDGRVLEFAFTQHLITPRPEPSPFGADDATRDGFALTLATDALEGRVLGITRTLRAPSADVPDYPALRAQLVGLYGEPSEESNVGDRNVLTWAWAEDGPVADLQGQPDRTMDHERADGRTVEVDYRPCAPRGLDRREMEYRFSHPRRLPAYPGCVATYTVSHDVGRGEATIVFSLMDAGLARAHVEAADAQLVDWLLHEPADDAPAEPSNMKL